MNKTRYFRWQPMVLLLAIALNGASLSGCSTQSYPQFYEDDGPLVPPPQTPPVVGENDETLTGTDALMNPEDIPGEEIGELLDDDVAAIQEPLTEPMPQAQPVVPAQKPEPSPKVTKEAPAQPSTLTDVKSGAKPATPSLKEPVSPAAKTARPVKPSTTQPATTLNAAE